MSELIKIMIPLVPEGKRRHRARMVAPKRPGAKPFVQEYPDPGQKQHLEEFTTILKSAWRKNPISSPVLLGVIAFMPIPKSKPEKWKVAAREGKIRPTTKPDLSNIVKLVEDLGNGILWQDDSQIVGFLQTAKYYSDTPKYVLIIQELVSEQSEAAQKVSPASDNHDTTNGVDKGRARSMGGTHIAAFVREKSGTNKWI